MRRCASCQLPSPSRQINIDIFRFSLRLGVLNPSVNADRDVWIVELVSRPTVQFDGATLAEYTVAGFGVGGPMVDLLKVAPTLATRMKCWYFVVKSASKSLRALEPAAS